MSTPSFPYSTLGSPIASGYKITRNATRSRVDTTCGIPFQHTRTSGSIFEIDATWSLGLSQYAVFADWYRTDVKDGTIGFTIDGMVLNGDQTTITARFAKPYKETDNGYGGRNVSVTLETSDADYISEAALDAALPAEPHTDAVTWPASLFGGVLQDWSESPTSNDFRGDVRGFALDYRKRKSNLVLTVADISFSMSNDAKKLFDAWYHYKLKDGSGWFWLWCEIRGVWKYAKVRFVDEVSMSYRAVSRWDVTGTIETVDAQYWDLSDCQDLVPHNNETKPTITRQSEGGAYLAGETVNLFVVASGTQPITYQWYLDGEPISGATSYEYSFTMDDYLKGAYHAIATNPLGSDAGDNISILLAGEESLFSSLTGSSICYHIDGYFYVTREDGIYQLSGDGTYSKISDLVANAICSSTDGSLYIVDGSATYKMETDGSYAVFSEQYGDCICQGPNGKFYIGDWDMFSAKLLEINALGEASVLANIGYYPYSWFLGVCFDGEYIYALASNQRIAQIAQDGTVISSSMVLLSNSYDIISSYDGYLYSAGIAGMYRISKDGVRVEYSDATGVGLCESEFGYLFLVGPTGTKQVIH